MNLSRLVTRNMSRGGRWSKEEAPEVGCQGFFRFSRRETVMAGDHHQRLIITWLGLINPARGSLHRHLWELVV